MRNDFRAASRGMNIVAKLVAILSRCATHVKLRAQVFRKFWRMPAASHLREVGKESKWMVAFLRGDQAVNAWANLYVKDGR